MLELKVFIKMIMFIVCTLSFFIKPTWVLCAYEVKCLERERQALFKFKQGVVDDRDRLSSWGSGEGERECCEWDGVECSNITGRVIGLNLEELFSGGKISLTLSELQHLNHLDLSYNSLGVDNLEWLPHLSSLRYLDLSGNNLHETNNWWQQISKLSFLEELHMSECQLPNTLSPAFDIFANSSLSTSLRILDLSDNNISSFAMFTPLFNNPITRLEELDLQKNMLNEIPLSLGNLSHLRVLDLSGNEFNQPLEQVFQNLSGKASKSLEVIYLLNNQIVGSLSNISQFSSLQTLGLGNNQLSGFHPQSLNQPSSLVYLDLSNNKIEGLLEDLGAYSSLQRLDLRENQIKSLPGSIWRLSNLQLFDLSSNYLKGMITEDQLDQLSNLPNLTSLDLSYNSQLSLNMSSNWSPPFKLTSLFLADCKVGPSFPKWLQTQRSLESLDMSSTGISDSLPTWLWNMSALTYLNLSNNHISGRIPHQSSNFFLAPIIDLSNNNFSGPIPLSLIHSSLLKLSKNKFSGSISHLCKAANLTNMSVLDLSDNQLTGELHDCWKNASSLQVLNLANNNFTCQIPSTFGNMPRLSTLHLRNNSFIGELPPSLRNCTQLRMLDVGGNNLTGTIPQWVGTHLKNLTVLSLRFNQFHGSINTTICHLTNIQVLDLSRNNLSGKIPKCFNSFTSLLQKNSTVDGIVSTEHKLSSYIFDGLYVDNVLVRWKGKDSEYKKLGLLKGIDLSNNKLVGAIPQDFSDMRGLIFLNLSGNHLTGNIMSNIGLMEMLEWLDLSRNELSGAIPNSLAELHFLNVLDLSYNKLTGKIPVGTQLQSFNSSSYAGNNQLCGLPLVECPRDSHYPSSIDRNKRNSEEEDDGLINREFYISMAFGFITGFWIVIGTLYVKHSWRRSYFNFWSKIGDCMYVTSAIYMTRFKRKFMA